MSELLYAPSDWGKVFHSLTTDEALGAGSAGPGKSLVLLMNPIQKVLGEHERCLDKHHPHPLRWGQSKGWTLHLRRTRPMLEQTIARSKRFYPAIDPEAEYHSQTYTWKFKSGYKIQFGHCKDPDDWQGYMSNEYDEIDFDELNQFTQEQYENISSRCRVSDPVLSQSLRVRSCSNPYITLEPGVTVNDPFWVRKRFVDPHPAGNVILKKRLRRRDGSYFYRTRMYLPATLYDNPDPAFVRQYEENLLDKPKHIQQALLYGNWYVTAGSYFGEYWNPQIHTCHPFAIPDHWPRFRSMDWGFKKPGVIGWWAIDDDGNLYCEREMSFQGQLDWEVANRVKEIEMKEGLWKEGSSIITGPADTQLWEERGDGGKTKAAVFAEKGVRWVKTKKGPFSRKDNGLRIIKRLKDHHHGTTTPGIVFFKNCKMCIRTLPSIPTDPHDPEAPMDGGDDHWLDMVSYAVSYASRRSAGISITSRNRGGDGDDDERDLGRTGYGQ